MAAVCETKVKNFSFFSEQQGVIFSLGHSQILENQIRKIRERIFQRVLPSPSVHGFEMLVSKTLEIYQKRLLLELVFHDVLRRSAFLLPEDGTPWEQKFVELAKKENCHYSFPKIFELNTRESMCMMVSLGSSDVEKIKRIISWGCAESERIEKLEEILKQWHYAWAVLRLSREAD